MKYKINDLVTIRKDINEEEISTKKGLIAGKKAVIWEIDGSRYLIKMLYDSGFWSIPARYIDDINYIKKKKLAGVHK